MREEEQVVARTKSAAWPRDHASRVFLDRDLEFRNVYYIFKAMPAHTDFVLDVLPNETYTKDLMRMRANWWTVRFGGAMNAHFQVLKADRDRFFKKLAAHRVQFLVPRARLASYARGDSPVGVLGGKVPRGSRQEHLRHVVSLLNKYKRLEIGIADTEFGIYFAVNRMGVVLGISSDASLPITAAAFALEETSSWQAAFEKLWARAITDRQRVTEFFKFLMRYTTSE
jgi:hypothetical protein